MNGKPSSPVLRGLGASNGARLLDPNRVTCGVAQDCFEEQLRAICERLFVSQSDHGIDAQRPARGDVAREQSDDTQN